VNRPWRVGILALTAIVVAALVLVARDAEPPEVLVATGLEAEPAPMPAARTGDALTTVWFCPSLGASEDGELDGAVTIQNPTAFPMSGEITYVPIDGEPVVQPVQLEEYGRAVLRPRDVVTGNFVAALVEVFGTNAVVAQTFTSPAGTSTSACATTPSPTWYLADGATTVDLSASLLLFNPFPDDAVVDVTFATDEGPRTPQALQGFLVPGRTLRRVDVDEAVRRNTQVSTAVEARTGRVVAGWIQTYRSPERQSVVATVPAATAGTQWWFANGRKGEGVRERVVLFNPHRSATAEVTVTVSPTEPPGAPPVTLTEVVPPLSSRTVDVAGAPEVPEARHSLLVTSSEPGIVAMRSLDLVGARNAATSQLGARLTAGVWYLPAAPPPGGTQVLTLQNPLGIDAVASVNRYGPAGATPLPGLEQLAVPPGGLVRLELAGVPGADGALEVRANGALVVEQLLIPAADQPGASSLLGIPELGPG
jgi:hypothetical protein